MRREVSLRSLARSCYEWMSAAHKSPVASVRRRRRETREAPESVWILRTQF